MFTVASSAKSTAPNGANHNQVKERGEKILSSDVMDAKYLWMFKTLGACHGRN